MVSSHGPYNRQRVGVTSSDSMAPPQSSGIRYDALTQQWYYSTNTSHPSFLASTDAAAEKVVVAAATTAEVAAVVVARVGRGIRWAVYRTVSICPEACRKRQHNQL